MTCLVFQIDKAALAVQECSMPAAGVHNEVLALLTHDPRMYAGNPNVGDDGITFFGTSHAEGEGGDGDATLLTCSVNQNCYRLGMKFGCGCHFWLRWTVCGSLSAQLWLLLRFQGTRVNRFSLCRRGFYLPGLARPGSSWPRVRKPHSPARLWHSSIVD